jgi:hypothetical protein
MFLLASASAVLAADTPASGCTQSALKGTYGFTLSGHHASIGEYALVGVFEVDGHDAVKGRGLQSINGNQSKLTFTGTYTVDDDCIGTADLAFANKLPAKVMFVIVGDGSEVLMIDIGGHTVETGVAKTIDAGFARRQTLTRPQDR